MIENKPFILKGETGKDILLDVHYKANKSPKPVVIFCHGYKGFKDWGAWHLMANAFAKHNFTFVKFNFSHNGGTINQPIDFPDLEAFGNNNYTKELTDLDTVIHWVSNNNPLNSEINKAKITLLGHSRGGGIVSIKASEDARITSLITLAGVSDYKSRFPSGDALTHWKNNNVYYVKNGRTKQNMPHFYQFYKNFIDHQNRLTISTAVKKINIPHMVIHGDADTSVVVQEAHIQHQWNPNSVLKIIPNSNHVFGASHPWQSQELPLHLNQVVNSCIAFLNHK